MKVPAFIEKMKKRGFAFQTKNISPEGVIYLSGCGAFNSRFGVMQLVLQLVYNDSRLLCILRQQQGMTSRIVLQVNKKEDLGIIDTWLVNNIITWKPMNEAQKQWV